MYIPSLQRIAKTPEHRPLLQIQKEMDHLSNQQFSGVNSLLVSERVCGESPFLNGFSTTWSGHPGDGKTTKCIGSNFVLPNWSPPPPPKMNMSPKKLPFQNEMSCSNHWFSGDMLVFWGEVSCFLRVLMKLKQMKFPTKSNLFLLNSAKKAFVQTRFYQIRNRRWVELGPKCQFYFWC